jgi:DNA-binding ferritin-like protein (Dps family)
MNFWEKVTGSDLTREWKAFEARAEKLPADYRQAWEQIQAGVFPHADFTGRNLMPILDGALGLLEESAADGLSVQEVPGGEGARTYRDRWRQQLNRDVAKKLGRLGG